MRLLGLPELVDKAMPGNSPTYGDSMKGRRTAIRGDGEAGT